MRFERVWSMPNRWTFLIKPIAQLLKEELTPGLWIDPFAGKYSPAKIRNDLNPEIKSDYHKDGLDFLKMFNDESIDGVLLDPPYSLRQISECYKKVGIRVTNETTQSSWHTRIRNEITRILRPGAKAICCGWSSTGIGKVRGFILTRILLVSHGGSHNDTIVTVENKQ